MIKKILFLLLALLLLGCSCGQDSSAAISAVELKNHVKFLASDDLAGRLTGSAGIARAETYLADEFARYGLKFLPGKTDYFDDFILYRTEPFSTDSALSFTVKGILTEARPQQDFMPHILSGYASVEGKIVFAGYGITDPTQNYDSYKNLDVKNAVVVIFRHEPPQMTQDDYSHNSYLLEKISIARQHGAVGVILLTDPHFSTAFEDLRFPASYSLVDPNPRRFKPLFDDFPVVQIAQDFAARVLFPSDTDLASIQRKLDAGESPTTLPLSTASIKIIKQDQAVPVAARNVTAMLPGTTAQWIVIGAHHDHLGAADGPGDRIYNGADDNASGVAGLLELAQAFSRRPLKKALVFVSFSAEEKGLLGSKYFVSRLTDPSQVSFMLDLDMIGRNPTEPINAITYNYSDQLNNAVSELAEHWQLAFQYQVTKPQHYFSDDYSFSGFGIKTLFIFTGHHPDYHKPSDQWDLLDYKRMTKIIGFAYDLIIWSSTNY